MDERRLLLVPRISEAQFPALRALMECEKGFPRTHCEWTEFWARRQVEEQARGLQPWFVDLYSAAFKSFLVLNKVPGTWRALALFIAQKVHWGRTE